jgi:hypothetical protein
VPKFKPPPVLFGLHFGHLLQTRPAARPHPKHDTEKPDYRAARFSRNKDWRDTLNNLSPISTAQLSLECHISRRSFRPCTIVRPAQLIFADLAGMFMVNVVAGGPIIPKLPNCHAGVSPVGRLAFFSDVFGRP